MHSRVRWLVSLWVLLAAVPARAELPALSPPVTGRSAPRDAAVVIGIEDYYTLPRTPYAARDAEVFHRFLVDTVGVAPDRVANLHAVRATREKMVEALASRAAQATGGTLWVYFSGHGAPAPGGDAWLIGADAEGSLSSLAARSLRRSEIQAAADRAGVGRVVVLLDACFSGKGRDGAALGSERFVAPGTFAAVPNVLFWAGATGGQVAGPYDPVRHGLFTYFAVGALSGWGDTDGDGQVTVNEASEYVRRMMGAALSTGERSQTPELAAPVDGGRWVLASGVRSSGGPDAKSLSLAGGAAPRPAVTGGAVQPGVRLDRGESIKNELTDDTGFLTVNTVPDGATLTLNGKEVGRAPQQLELMAGRYVVVAELGGLYHEASEQVTLGTAGARVTLTLRPAFGRLEVSSEPPGADVWLDGEKAGTTPFARDQVRSGTYDLRVERALHLSHRGTVSVSDGQTTREAVRLSANYGALVVESDPAGAAIWLNGEATGHVTPHTFEGLQVGAYVVKLARDGYGEASDRGLVERQGRASLRLALQAKLGLLSVTARTADGRPCDGKVFLDGAEQGVTPLKLQVTATTHEVEVRCAVGSARQTVTVEHNGKHTAALEVGGARGYVRIEPGRFTMGSPSGEAGRDDDERQHEVVLTRPYLLKSTEVTQGEWRALMGGDPSYFSGCGDTCPVERVSWWEALRYLNALSRSEGLEECYELGGCTGTLGGGCPKSENGGRYCTGDYTCTSVKFKGAGCRGYRLPTESEWEYAARAGTGTATYAGELRIVGTNNGPVLDPMAWYGGNSGASYAGALDCSGWEQKQYPLKSCGPQPVGGKKPNGLGLYDMLGNVYEWTGDWYGDYPGGRLTDPEGAMSGASRVFRGGSWVASARFVRAALRGRDDPAWRIIDVGFRAARSVP